MYSTTLPLHSYCSGQIQSRAFNAFDQGGILILALRFFWQCKGELVSDQWALATDVVAQVLYGPPLSAESTYEW